MLKKGATEKVVRISKKKERIVIDDEVLAVLGIMDEIIEFEETEWRKLFFTGIKQGRKDISIMIDSPMERTKYYDAKKEFIDKIYQCCIYKGLVKYEDILKTKVG